MRNILSILFASLTLFSCSVNKSAEKQNTFCNPMNLDYGWGKLSDKRKRKARSAADPVIVLFKKQILLVYHNGHWWLSRI